MAFPNEEGELLGPATNGRPQCPFPIATMAERPTRLMRPLAHKRSQSSEAVSGENSARDEFSERIVKVIGKHLRHHQQIGREHCAVSGQKFKNLPRRAA